MDVTVQSLVDRLLKRYDSITTGRRVVVGLCGIPGSGKSQLALHVIRQLNHQVGKDVGIVVGMDGWHLTRAELAAMPDPQLAKDKRGAPWTFDAKSYADFITQLREASLDQQLYAPSFSHALKDPIADDIVIRDSHQIVIMEGLYANIDEGDWVIAAKQYDERWVVQCNEAAAKARLIVRHVATGVGKDEQEAEWRADNNDIPNGHYLLQHVLEPAIRIDSIDDNDWSGVESKDMSFRSGTSITST